MYKIAICDDDKYYRRTVREILEKMDLNEEIQFFEYESGELLLTDINIRHNLIFVDICMPGLDGNKTIRLLRKSNKEAVLIFCSSFFELTLDSINIGQPFRYILKNVDNSTLKKEMPQILKETKLRMMQYHHYLTVAATGKVIRVLIDNLLYISVVKRGSCLYIENEGQNIEEIRCRETITELYEQLEKKGFEYAHNSYIVNLRKVVTIKRTMLQLSGGTELNVSRSKRKEFEKRFRNILHRGWDGEGYV